MKRIYFIAALSACLFISSSCQKEGAGDGLDRFTAYHEYQETKTVLKGLTPLWTPSETICIYDGVNNVFTSEAASPAAVANFKGNLNGQGKARKDFIAVSPFSESYSFLFGEFPSVYDIPLPSEQTAVKDSYDPAAMIAMAYTTDSNLNFRNLCSLLKFTVASDGVTSVELAAIGEETIAGRFNVRWNSTGNMLYTPHADAKKSSVVLKGTFEKGATYYISILPAQLESGFTLTLNGKVQAVKEIVPVTFARSGIINVGEVSLDPKENNEPGDGGNEGGNTGDNGDNNGNTGGNTGQLYLLPGDDWKIDGARFEAYFFDNGDAWAWAEMTDTDMDEIYECEVPEGFTKVIFCRMDPAKPLHSWDSKWNQTVDLEIKGNLFTITIPWGDDANGWKADGTWSEK